MVQFMDLSQQRSLYRCLAVALGSLGLMLVFLWPLNPGLLAVALAVYVVVAAKFQSLWLPVVIATVLALDTATYTGWQAYSEFDILLLATTVVNLWLGRMSFRVLRMHPRCFFVLGALVATYAVGLSVTLWTAESFPESLLGYDSPLHAIRQFVALLWPVVLLPQLAYLMERDFDGTFLRIACGLSLGLLAVALSVVQERQWFTDLFDLRQAFRVSGGISSMNVGGASLDALLAATIPFLAVSLLGGWRRFMPFTLAIAVVSLYAVVVTYTRTTYAAVALSVLSMGVVAILVARPRLLLGFATLAVLGTLVVVAIGATMMSGSPFMQSRWQNTALDLEKRFDHWSQVLSIRDPGLAPALVGHGLGSYVQKNFAALGTRRKPGGAKIIEHGHNSFLRLEGGRSTYIDQRLVTERVRYTVRMDLRSRVDARITFSVCEKDLMYSRRCRSGGGLVAGDGRWHPIEETDLEGFSSDSEWSSAPVYLSLTTPGPNITVDVDNVSLVGDDGSNAVINGDFEGGRLRWFFSQDDHLAWHVKNFWVYVWFEHGLLGLVVHLALLGVVLGCLVSAIRSRDRAVVVLTGSLVGLVVTGLFDSVIDTPRPTVIAGLVVVLTLLRCTIPGSPQLPRRTRLSSS